MATFTALFVMRWYGDEDGAEFEHDTAISDYLPSQTLDLFSSCCHASITTHVPRPSLRVPRSSASSLDLSGWTVIKLPSKLVSALLKAMSLEALGAALQLVVADTGATDHMLLDRSAFNSHKLVRNLHMHMGKNSYAMVLGQGMAIISLNSQLLLFRGVLHIPALWVTRYSLCAHIRQPGCGFIGSYKMGLCVYFPGVILSIDTSTDCNLSYAPLGKFASLSTLHYVQPSCAPTTYPTERLALRAHTGSDAPPSLLVPAPPAIIEDDSSQWCLSLIPMKIFPHSTPPSQNAPLNLKLKLCLPLSLSLHPLGFCCPLPMTK
jgi:hypothetical protein